MRYAQNRCLCVNQFLPKTHPIRSNRSWIGLNCGRGIICIALISFSEGKSTVTSVFVSVLPWKTYKIKKNCMYSTHKLHKYDSYQFEQIVGLGLMCLTHISTIFQLYHGSQLYWWKKSLFPYKNHRPATVETLLYFFLQYYGSQDVSSIQFFFYKIWWIFFQSKQIPIYKINCRSLSKSLFKIPYDRDNDWTTNRIFIL